MKNIFALLFIVVGFVIAFLSLGTEEQKPPLRIGMNAWPGYEILYLAKEKGFYKEEGVDVEIVQYTSLEDVRFGFEQGQIDIMASTIIELILTADRTQKQPVAFMVPDFSDGGDVVISRTGIRNLSELRGKRIAVEPESLGLFMLARTLKEAELTIDDVEIVGMSQLDMHMNMMDGEIDVAVTYPPTSVNILNEVGGSAVVFDTSQIPGEVVDVVSTSEAVMHDRQDDLKAIVRAWDKALHYLTLNEEDAISLMAKRQGISNADFKDALLGVRVLSSSDQLVFTDVKPNVKNALKLAADVLRKSDYIGGVVDAESLIDTSILKGAYEAQ